MLQAGTATASLILRDYATRLAHGVAILAGTGNNGGDAYVVAAQLARAGVRVRLHAIDAPRTDDARRAAALVGHAARATVVVDDVRALLNGEEQLVIDGLLGTGQQGALRESVRDACAVIHQVQQRGALVVVLDVPTGLDASTGELADGAVRADCTACYGTLKRGLLVQRAHAGRVVLLDIGLGGHAEPPSPDVDAWCWLDAAAVAARVPTIAWNAHKGRRGRVLVAGGEMGMAGAAVYAARAALLAGAGIVHALVDTQSVTAVQSLCEAALAHRWPALDSAAHLTPASYALTPVGTMRPDILVDAVAVGPGLGRSRRAGQLLQHVVASHRTVPMVLDADALWHAADAAQALGTDAATVLSHWTRDMAGMGAHGREMQVVCTPHPGEFARLTGAPLPTQWQARADLLRQFAARAGVTMLLKGTPTLVASPGVPQIAVVPHGTALLATGGSGDCLTGMIGTLLAQGLSAHDAAVVGATVHGQAAELATARAGTVRGTTLNDLFDALPDVWRAIDALSVGAPSAHAPYVLAELPGL
jgi:NAD(P)H-hydrate epimerase